VGRPRTTDLRPPRRNARLPVCALRDRHARVPVQQPRLRHRARRHATQPHFANHRQHRQHGLTGVVVRFPELKIGVTEAGICGCPPLQPLEKETSSAGARVPVLTERPSPTTSSASTWPPSHSRARAAARHRHRSWSSRRRGDHAIYALRLAPPRLRNKMEGNMVPFSEEPPQGSAERPSSSSGSIARARGDRGRRRPAGPTSRWGTHKVVEAAGRRSACSTSPGTRYGLPNLCPHQTGPLQRPRRDLHAAGKIAEQGSRGGSGGTGHRGPVARPRVPTCPPALPRLPGDHLRR